jgi:hypothetical protein
MLRMFFAKAREIDLDERSLSMLIANIAFAIIFKRLLKFVITSLKELINSFSATERSSSRMTLIVSESITAYLKIISIAYFVQRLLFLRNGILVSAFSTKLFPVD